MPPGIIVNSNSGIHVHISALILLRLVKDLLIKTIYFCPTLLRNFLNIYLFLFNLYSFYHFYHGD